MNNKIRYKTGSVRYCITLCLKVINNFEHYCSMNLLLLYQQPTNVKNIVTCKKPYKNMNIFCSLYHI